MTKRDHVTAVAEPEPDLDEHLGADSNPPAEQKRRTNQRLFNRAIDAIIAANAEPHVEAVIVKVIAAMLDEDRDLAPLLAAAVKARRSRIADEAALAKLSGKE